MGSDILIIEDDEAFASMLGDALGHTGGYSVTVCHDPREAIPLFEKESFRLLVSDFRMPHLNGAEVVRSFREKHPLTPVIMISAYMGAEEMREAGACGVDRVLRKPFEVARLLAEVEHLLRGASMEATGSDGEGRSKAYPAPTVALADGHKSSRAFLQRLWRQFQRGARTFFVFGPPGAEFDLVARELSEWANPREEKPCLNVSVNDFLRRSDLRDFAYGEVSEGKVSKVVVLSDLKSMSENDERLLDHFIKGEEGELSRRGVWLCFPVAMPEGEFVSGLENETLAHRISADSSSLPPLAGRYLDIVAYLDRLSGFFGDPSACPLEGEAVRLLIQHSWPGGFDELRHTMEHLAAFPPGMGVASPDRVHGLLQSGSSEPLDEAFDLGLDDLLRKSQTTLIETVMGSSEDIDLEGALSRLGVDPQGSGIAKGRADDLPLLVELVPKEVQES